MPRQAIRQRRILAGLCPECGQQVPKRGARLCSLCSRGSARATRRVRAIRREASLCIECGALPPETGRVRCAACLLRRRDQTRVWRSQAAGAAGSG